MAAPAGLAVAGLLLCALGVLVIAIAQRQMGESFRIGIDDAKTPLVSRGLFRHVRNPIYSGLLVLLLGVMLAIPCAASVLLGAPRRRRSRFTRASRSATCSRCTATPIARTPRPSGASCPASAACAPTRARAAVGALACRLVLDPTREGVSAADWAAATAGCYELRVRRVIDETSDARSIVLEIPPSLAERFRYRPGQFLSFKIPHRGAVLTRSYSLASSPDCDAEHKVTVKRIADGRVSNWINDHVARRRRR